MATINKEDVQVKASQRLDDTDQGGGQMTSIQIVSGSINNLFPDISRLDRVYGRVSLRKAFLAVSTESRSPYYGSHIILTQHTKDPNVGICFFTSEDWFDTRYSAKTRIESYLVKGPFYPAALWGNHFRGSKQIQLHTYKDWTAPEVGDVIVLVENEGDSDEKMQFLRITGVEWAIQNFTYASSSVYQKKIITLEIGDMLKFDFTGTEIFWEGQATNVHYGSTSQATLIYTTVAADASRYYGVTTLSEDADEGSLHFRVHDINVPIVPSAQSQTAITDAGVGQAITPMLQTNEAITKVTRSIAYTITTNSKLFIGEGVLPGSFEWTGGLTLTDNYKGDILNGGTVVGSIAYATGICTFTNISGSTSGTGTVSYVPACQPTEVASTGAIQIDISNRGFAYVYNCNPLPKPGTAKIDYLSGGKWYSMQDRGDGSISGADTTIGSGAINYMTGSLSITVGAMPDVGSLILIFWAKDAPYYDLSGETLPVRYELTTQHEGVAKNTFECSWNANAAAVMDDGSGNLVMGSWSVDHWVKTATVLGTLHYPTGKASFGIHSTQAVPAAIGDFHIRYMYGDKHSESLNPNRQGDGSVLFYLTHLPVEEGTFSIVWHTDQREYVPETRIILPPRDPVTLVWNPLDPTFTYQDDTTGHFKNETDASPNFFPSTIDYDTGAVHIMPDREGTFPIPQYAWRDSGMTDNLGHPIHEFVFSSYRYFPAACVWPTDGVFQVEYSSLSGSTVDDYYEPIPRTFYIKEHSHIEMVPGSLDITAVVGATNYYMMDIGTGKLFRDVIGTTGVGTECGTINYVDRVVTITDNNISNRDITIKSCAGTAAVDPVQMMVFRAPGAPITPGSLSVRATLGTGVLLSATSDFTGALTGIGVEGFVDFSTGICRVSFGSWVDDDFAELPVNERPAWYVGAPIDGTLVWKPYSVRASTVMINCVIQSYLPLDSKLLGLDPVRLPIDGRVPIFRDGYIVLVHNTQHDVLQTVVAAGALPALSRTGLNLVELWDSRSDELGGSQYWPDGGNYTVNLETGVITILPTFDLTGFTQPFRAIHRVEDFALASDVQITGHIAITTPLTHDYPKDTTMVSSVLPTADLQSRAYNEFDQQVWGGVWSDDLIGSPVSLANYNFVDYPITVINKTCTKERWLILVKTPTTVDIIGENLGTLATGISIVTGNYDPILGIWAGAPGFLGGYIAVRNKNFSDDPYWVMHCAGFGAGWVASNGIRFNTDAANYPLWFVRTTLQAAPTEATDSYAIQLRGDNS